MGPISCSETSVRNYHQTLHNIRKQLRSHLVGGRKPEIKPRQCLSVCLCVCRHETTLHPLDWIFIIFYIWWLMENLLKIQVLLQSGKNKGYFTCVATYKWPIILAEFILIWEMFQTQVVEKKIRKSWLLWDNNGKYGTAGQVIDDIMLRRNMPFACFIINATGTHSKHVILFAFPRQNWWCQPSSVLIYTYSACLVTVRFI
jgi:hypothetical protein